MRTRSGFTIGGTVVDLRTLRNGFLWISSGAVTVVTALLALGPTTHRAHFEYGDTNVTCATHGLEVQVLAATAKALYGSNTTCVPKLSIHELLGQ